MILVIGNAKKPYIRIGSHKTDLRKHPDFTRIIYNSQEDWTTKIVQDATIKDLDPEALLIARETGQKAKYSKNKAFYQEYYLDLILKSIKEHQSLNRQDIDELLWDTLPVWMKHIA